MFYSGVLAAQLGVGALIVMGDSIFQQLGSTPPAFYQTLKNNKLISGLVVYMAGNFLKSQITSTQAFEIYVNEKLV
jgi:thioredoxin reductase-like selenoprotein T